jgi:hypothetical protein
MNFFGHAAMAERVSKEPPFVLGAMLPDFSSMLGLRPPSSSHPGVAGGIAFHHATDVAFHELSVFRELCSDAMRLLAERGVSRGTRRAVAHVGVELLIDVELSEDPAARSAYLAALHAGRDPAVVSTLSWPADQQARLARLAARLEERSDGAKPTTEMLVERLARTLSERPRLAMEDAARPHVADWVELCRARVVASTPALVLELTRVIERDFPKAATTG